MKMYVHLTRDKRRMIEARESSARARRMYMYFVRAARAERKNPEEQ